MPIVRYTLSGAVRRLRVFLDLKAGLIQDGSPGVMSHRCETPLHSRESGGGQKRELERLRGVVAVRDRELAELRSQVTKDVETSPGGVRPENMIWIFGTGRSGNTWLSSIMEEMGHAVWREPSVGKLFGEFYYFGSREGQRGTSNFVLGEKQRDTWVSSIRSFVLEGASARFPHRINGCLIVKEQVGSVGAPLIMEALPESKMLLLIRDPRDVVASWVNANRKGGWRYERLSNSDHEQILPVDEDIDAFAEERANHYLKNVSKAKQAYDQHEGPKVLVRYEDLRANTMSTMRRVCLHLGVEVDEEDLAQAVEKHAWENVPEENKGEGKFHRKAKPGGWQEDLTPEQAEKVERITAPLIREFYPG